MKRLFIAILPLILFSCAKEENINVGFREPTCQDTTDDGRFEEFTSSEMAQFLTDSIRFINNFGVDSIADMYISGRELRNNEIFYDPYIVYRLKTPADFYMYIPTKEAQEQYYTWEVPYNSIWDQDSVKINIYNIRPLQLEPGCYRMYYVFTTPDSMRMVITKGHYDIEIK